MSTYFSSKARERVLRSELKTISYEVSHLVVTFGLVWVIFGSPVWAAGFAVLDILVDTVLYFLHERIWAHIPNE